MTDILPLNIPKRGLSIEEAAEYCGVSANTMSRHGPSPLRIGERVVYDRKSLDAWLDRLGGHDHKRDDDPEATLLEAIHARKAPIRHPAG